MIGIKIGTGGSSGHKYLKETAEKHTIFDDFSNLSSYIIPRSALPELPNNLKKELGFISLMKSKKSQKLEKLNTFVCGSTSGIGRATAIEFANASANVTLVGRNKTKLQELLKILANNGKQNHQFLLADFDNFLHLKKVIANHIEDGNSYHILVNNSGGPKSGLIKEAKIEDFTNAFNRHLICNHILLKALLPGMIKFNYGRVINIISTSVKQPIAGLGVSNTIRAAVASWAKTLSFELAADKITVNNILPGFTNTDRLKSIIKHKAESEKTTLIEIENKMKATIPSNRFGEPYETAKAILFLASTDSNYINGTSIAVDGGRLTSI